MGKTKMSTVKNININDPAQLAAILASQNGQNVNLNDQAQLAALLASQQNNIANLNANSILALLSNNNNNINSLNGLDVNTLNALLSSGVNANQIAALVGSSFNSQQISALLLNNNGNINSLGGQDIQLQQLLSDLGNGNIATGATNMANLLPQATSNNPTIANDLNNLLAAQGLIANRQNVNGGAGVTGISSSSTGSQVISGQGVAVAAVPAPAA